MLDKYTKVFFTGVLCITVCGCTADGGTAVKSADLAAKAEALSASQGELGLSGKYASVDEIDGDFIDKKLIGTWKDPVWGYEFTCSEDGTITFKGGTDEPDETRPYTCLTVDGRNIFCEDMVIYEYLEDGTENVSSGVFYYVYDVTDHALYFLSLEDLTAGMDSSLPLQICYRADGQGSIDASMKAEPVTTESFYGEWTGEKGTFTIDSEGLKTDAGTYKFSLNEENDFVLEKDGVSTVLTTRLCSDISGDAKVHQVKLEFVYEGRGDEDIPNLSELMFSEHYEHNVPDWLYYGEFFKK